MPEAIVNAPQSDATSILVAGRNALRPRVVIDYTNSLGGGAFGDVYAATFKDAPENLLAVKVVKEDGLSEKAKAQLRREVALHTTIDMDYILKCHGAYDHQSSLHLVLDRCAGDVASAMRSARGAAAISVLTPRLMRQLFLALQHLHDDAVGVVHSDVKPSNLLLDAATGDLRLCDLGAAARVHNGGRSTLVGSPAYTAPEVVAIAHLGLDISSGATYNFSVDVWSAGIVLVEMLTAGNTLPFPSEPRDPSAQPAAICFKPPNLEPSSAFTPAARSLTLRLLAKQSYLRPSAEEVVRDEDAAADDGFLRSGKPTEAEAKAVAVVLDCLATHADDGVAARLADACVLVSPPPPPPPQRERQGGTTTEGSSSPEAEDCSPMSVPSLVSWASSLVDGGEESPVVLSP